MSAINIIGFYDDVLDTDFYKQFLKTSITKTGLVVPNLLNNTLLQFQCDLGNVIGDTFTSQVFLISAPSGIETDITSEITLSHKKTATQKYLFHLSDEMLTTEFGGLCYLKIVANDTITTVTKYSDVFCFADEATPSLADVDLIDGGFNADLKESNYVIDGGFNEV